MEDERIIERVQSAMEFIRRAHDAAYMGTFGELRPVVDGSVCEWIARARSILEGLTRELQKGGR